MFAPGAKIGAKSNRIDLTLRKTLTPRSSERWSCHRNVKFATFQEGWQAHCKTRPQNGVKVAPWGAGASQICPIDLTIAKKIWRLVAQRVDFTEMWNLPHFEEAGRLCKTIPQNGVKVAPPGGQEGTKICPIDFQWCRTAHEMGRPFNWTAFSIEHNSGSTVS